VHDGFNFGALLDVAVRVSAELARMTPPAVVKPRCRPSEQPTIS